MQIHTCQSVDVAKFYRELAMRDYAPSQRSKNYLWHRERRIEWDCFAVWIFIAAVAGVEVFGLWCLAGAFVEMVAPWLR